MISFNDIIREYRVRCKKLSKYGSRLRTKAAEEKAMGTHSGSGYLSVGGGDYGYLPTQRVPCKCIRRTMPSYHHLKPEFPMHESFCDLCGCTLNEAYPLNDEANRVLLRLKMWFAARNYYYVILDDDENIVGVHSPEPSFESCDEFARECFAEITDPQELLNCFITADDRYVCNPGNAFLLVLAPEKARLNKPW